MDLIQPLTKAFEKKYCHRPFFVNIYSYPYLHVIKREIALAEITADDRILNIGCGSIPFTALLLARLSGAEILALDEDEQTAEKARLCINRMSLSHLINVRHGRGQSFPASGFTAAVVALQAAPKHKILTNVRATGRRGLRVIFREPRPKLKKQYDHLPGEEIPTAECRQYLPTFNRSVLFVNRE